MKRLAALLSIYLTAGCYFEPPTYPDYAREMTIVLVSWPDSVLAGDSLALQVQVLDEHDRPFGLDQTTVTWRTSNVGVAGLHPGDTKTKKVVLGVGPGVATIRVDASQPPVGRSQDPVKAHAEKEIRVYSAPGWFFPSMGGWSGERLEP